MTWFSKIGFLSILLCASSIALARRFTFGDPADGASARWEAHPTAQKDSPASVEIIFSLAGFDVNPADDGFARLSVEGLAPLELRGKPALYTGGELLAVPQGFGPRLEVIDIEQQEIPDVLIEPAQRKLRCGHTKEFSFDSALYRSQSVYPARPIELQTISRMRGVNLVRIALQPFQMDMGKRSLKVTYRLRARITLERIARTQPARLPRAFFQIARWMTVNGEELGSYLLADPAPEGMLIITADALRGVLDPLIAWKQSKGIKVDVVTLSQAGGTNDSVKTYIQNYYNGAATKPSYLLFVGNKDTMPTFMESTSSGQAASDWRYALQGGTDRVPSLLYGRLVADNADEAKTQVDRIVAYEKSPDLGNWYPNAITIASKETSSNTQVSDEQYVQQIEAVLKNHGYQNVDRFYEAASSATAANITRAVNDGRTWLAYIGHGAGDAWGSTNDDFGVTQVDGLANPNRLPILIDVACQNASWVKMKRCFGKAWVTHTSGGQPAGAVGYYGGSVNISWDPPAVMSVGIAKSHFEKPVASLGASVLAGQLYLEQQMGSNDDTLDNLKWYNLFGDPSLVIRTAVPRDYTVAFDISEGRSTIQIEVADLVGQPIAGVLAALSANSQLLSVAKTDETGSATLTTPGPRPPGSLITTTGYGLETHQVAAP